MKTIGRDGNLVSVEVEIAEVERLRRKLDEDERRGEAQSGDVEADPEEWPGWVDNFMTVLNDPDD